jgi:hypothetical protein
MFVLVVGKKLKNKLKGEKTMSKLEINNDKTKGKLLDVTFAYVKLQSGSYKYQSTTELEYCVDCIVNKETAKAYKKAFPKNGYKEIDTSEFEAQYKIKPPFPDQDEQFIIKVKANANLRTDIPSAGLVYGDLVPYTWKTRPKVYLPVDGGVKDITMTTLVSNGSKGDVALSIRENSFGTFPQLTGILVKDLIEYVKEGSGSDFGNVVGGYNPGDGNPQQVPTINEQEVEEEGGGNINDDLDSQIPF